MKPPIHSSRSSFSSGIVTMSKPEPKLTRGHLRVWLKWVLQSSLLDRLSPRYDAEGASKPLAPEEVARRLLARLQDPQLSGSTLASVVAALRQFRDWVQARQKMSRQVILSDLESANHSPFWLENWAAAMSGGADDRPSPTHPQKLMPRSHPMWDEDVDG